MLVRNSILFNPIPNKWPCELKLSAHGHALTQETSVFLHEVQNLLIKESLFLVSALHIKEVS